MVGVHKVIHHKNKMGSDNKFNKIDAEYLVFKCGKYLNPSLNNVAVGANWTRDQKDNSLHFFLSLKSAFRAEEVQLKLELSSDKTSFFI